MYGNQITDKDALEFLVSTGEQLAAASEEPIIKAMDNGEPTCFSRVEARSLRRTIRRSLTDLRCSACGA